MSIRELIDLLISIFEALAGYFGDMFPSDEEADGEEATA